jgi:hypothetical protein
MNNPYQQCAMTKLILVSKSIGRNTRLDEVHTPRITKDHGQIKSISKNRNRFSTDRKKNKSTKTRWDSPNHPRGCKSPNLWSCKANILTLRNDMGVHTSYGYRVAAVFMKERTKSRPRTPGWEWRDVMAAGEKEIRVWWFPFPTVRNRRGGESRRWIGPVIQISGNSCAWI